VGGVVCLVVVWRARRGVGVGEDGGVGVVIEGEVVGRDGYW